MVVVGADAIFQGYIANKVGTRVLLLAAWTGNCKRLVLADSSKFLAEVLIGLLAVGAVVLTRLAQRYIPGT